MYNFEKQTNPNLEIDDEAKAYLLETVKWAKFISTVGFVAIGICTIMGLLIFLFAPGYSSYNSASGFKLSSIGLVYFVFGILCFYPTYAIYKFSNHIKEGVNFLNKEQFNAGLLQLKGYFKYLGILVIVELAIMVLCIGIGIVVAIVYSAHRY